MFPIGSNDMDSTRNNTLTLVITLTADIADRKH